MHEPANDMKERLRADLRAAMKDRRLAEVKVLRALIAALDNAEAPAGPAANAPWSGDGPTEIARLILSDADVQRAIGAELGEREQAVIELERVGRAEHAETVRAEALVVRRYLA